jgi:phage tail sheath protein FI
MPEYLAPGVYVEEISFRAKSIEGVGTSVAGFIGPTRYGPTSGEPELLTSFADFERIYGGIDNLAFDDGGGNEEEQINFMAHAVRAFYDNGGARLYVTRVYTPVAGSDGHASAVLGSPVGLTLRARFPGHAGDMRVIISPQASPNILRQLADGTRQLSGARQWDTVYIRTVPNMSSPLAPVVTTVATGLYDVVRVGEVLALESSTGGQVPISDLDPALLQVHQITFNVRVAVPSLGRFSDEEVWEGLGANPRHRNAITELFTQQPNSRSRQLTIPFAIEPAGTVTSGVQLATALLGNAALSVLETNLLTDAQLRAMGITRPRPSELEQTVLLDGGSDGQLPGIEAYRGREAERDNVTNEVQESTGLITFEDVEEISMVAAPGYSFNYNANTARADQIVQLLITHCEIRMRYRVALLDAPNNQILSEVQAFRGQFDSTHAALYYPWITVLNPLDPNGREEIQLPPSGFVAGICARTDIRHGVFKAPANEVVLGAINFETLINKAQQEILNPRGINCFRFFENRGFRLWGARTISSDPEWKYINVRRYFAYLEHSIDRGTQWAVFENNGDVLWANVRRTVEDFLFNEWRNGALLGLKPEEAFFVRCDRSTMSQNDLDNGRLICLIGVSVLKPAEFVIFRIGQMTADSRR